MCLMVDADYRQTGKPNESGTVMFTLVGRFTRPFSNLLSLEALVKVDDEPVAIKRRHFANEVWAHRESAFAACVR